MLLTGEVVLSLVKLSRTPTSLLSYGDLANLVLCLNLLEDHELDTELEADVLSADPPLPLSDLSLSSLLHLMRELFFKIMGVIDGGIFSLLASIS